MKDKKEFIYRDKVRYSDCDMHQHLNHARYFSFMEQARVEFCKKLGFNQTGKGKDYKSIPFIIVSAHCDYKAPAYLDDELIVRVTTTHIGNTSFRLDYRIEDATTRKLLAEAYTVQLYFDYNKMKPVPIPKVLKAKLQKK
ncbi:MAG: thioesterase family protein [Deltaproteobacteria bacterium]|nr:thioesterase family protein [Deltaproteobacteria bacterium]